MQVPPALRSVVQAPDEMIWVTGGVSTDRVFLVPTPSRRPFAGSDRVCVFDHDGLPAGTLETGGLSVTCLRSSADGETLAMVAADRHERVSVRAGGEWRELQSVRGHAVDDMALSGDGRLVVVAMLRGRVGKVERHVALFDTSTGSRLNGFDDVHSAFAIAFDHSGSTLAVTDGSFSTGWSVYAVPSGERIYHDDDCSFGIALSSDGARVARYADRYSATVEDARSGTGVVSIAHELTYPFWDRKSKSAARGKCQFVGAREGYLALERAPWPAGSPRRHHDGASVSVFDATSGAPVCVLEPLSAPQGVRAPEATSISDIVAGPKGHHLLVLNNDGAARLWEFPS